MFLKSFYEALVALQEAEALFLMLMTSAIKMEGGKMQNFAIQPGLTWNKYLLFIESFLLDGSNSFKGSICFSLFDDDHWQMQKCCER